MDIILIESDIKSMAEDLARQKVYSETIVKELWCASAAATWLMVDNFSCEHESG